MYSLLTLYSHCLLFGIVNVHMTFGTFCTILYPLYFMHWVNYILEVSLSLSPLLLALPLSFAYCPILLPPPSLHIHTHLLLFQNFLRTKEEKLKNQQREYEAQLQYRQHLQVATDSQPSSFPPANTKFIQLGRARGELVSMRPMS